MTYYQESIICLLHATAIIDLDSPVPKVAEMAVAMPILSSWSRTEFLVSLKPPGQKTDTPDTQ